MARTHLPREFSTKAATNNDSSARSASVPRAKLSLLGEAGARLFRCCRNERPFGEELGS